MVNVRWKLKEHKELISYGYKHSLIKDFFDNNYRKDSYKKWAEEPKIRAKKEGCDFSDDTPGNSLREIFIEKIYDFPDFIPKKGDVVIDVGASYGDTAIWYAKKFGAKVMAFEPLKDIYEILLKNIDLNKADVIAYNIALGNGKNINGKRQGNMLAIGNEEKFETKRLDDFEFERVDLIKIDVEGFELDVLEGAKKTIMKHRPKIILEVHSKDLFKGCTEFLKKLDYKIEYYGRKIKNKDMDLVQNLFFMPK
ncbi:MAG: FkbM family methyltransferase [Thermoplasmata archaeon]